MKTRLIIFIAVILNLVTASSAGQKILYPEVNPADARFDNIEIDNGNAGPTVYSLMQDSKGFIWSGTETGLYRFDGVKSVKYSYGTSDTTLAGFIVTCIYEETNGNIWAGTHGALNRINSGQRTISHFFPDSSDLSGPDNYIRLIRKDRNGKFWILTDRNVFRLNAITGEFTRFFVDSLSVRSREQAIVDERDKFIEDKNDNIWIATNKGLFKFSTAENGWKRVFPGASQSDRNINPSVNCILADKDGIWVGTAAKGLIRIDNQEKESYPVLSNPENKHAGNVNISVSSIATTDDGMVWFTSGNTISKLDITKGEITKYLIRSKSPPLRGWEKYPGFKRIFHGKNGELWFVDYGNGLVLKFNTETEKTSFFLVPRYVVLDAIQDNTGSLWFGCVANNIFRLVTDPLPYMTRSIPNITGVSVGNFQNMSEDSVGNIFLLFSTGLHKIKNPEISSELLPEKTGYEIKGLYPQCIIRDKDHKFWIGYNKGVIQNLNSSGDENRVLTLPGGPFRENEAYIRIIREDPDGNIWLATADKGIFRINKNENKIRLVMGYKEITGNDKTGSIFDFFVDRYNNIWLSTFDKLFRVNNETKKIENLTGFEGAGYTYSSMVCRIIEDNKKNIWILNTMNSPFLYDNLTGKFSKPFNRDLIPEVSFNDIQFDNKGNIWLSENNKITFFETQNRSGRVFNFSMQGYGVQSLKLKSGMIAYILNNRLIIFPSEPVLNRNIPHVYITGLMINGKESGRESDLWQHSANLDKLELRHDRNTLKIEFAALNYNHPELNRYRYFMNGFDKDTTAAGLNSFAEYRNMPPGRYRFWVTGSNNDGLWNPNGATLEIRIHPPWYRTLLAWIIYVLIIVSLIIFYIKLRIHRLTRDKERLENEVRLRTEELEIKNLRLAEIDRIKTQFFTDISHEIRTPLTLITGPMDILAKSFEGNNKVSGMLSIMKRNADRLMQLVNELLDIVRIDAGKMNLTISEVDIIRNLRMLVYEFLSLAESRQIKYIVEIPETSCIAWVDTDKINKIITNLLSNAFRYTNKGGTVKCMIKIEKEDPEQIRQFITITVSDTGRGISKENLEKIFERFYRVEGHHEINGYGTGIGLSMVREFVNLFHGDIKVESTPGKGSEFTVTIPLGKDHLSASEYVIKDKLQNEQYSPPPITRTELQMENHTITKQADLPKILVIEDNADLRNFIVENLSGTYHLLEAENGKTGSGLAYSMMPDLILSDIMMPDIDGIQLCTKLKNDEHTSHIPIILLTAKATTDEKLTGLKSGADDYVIKPFIMDELKTRISNLLSTREKLKLKYLDPKSLEIIEESRKSPDDRFMEKVIGEINRNLNNFDFDVAALHSSLGISRMHLSRKLRALTGLSPHSLISRMRLEKAAELFRLNRGNITEIANSVGISNPANFSKSFREHFGTSPRAYMKQFRSADKTLL